MIGDSWEKLGIIVPGFTSIDDLVYLGKNGAEDIILAGCTKPVTGVDNRLAKSINRGTTWVDKGRIAPAAGDRLHSLCHLGSGVVLAGTSSPDSEIWKSLDWGESWVKKWLAYEFCYAIEDCGEGVVCSGQRWVPGNRDRLGQSLDSGDTWTPKESITTNAQGLSCLLYLGGSILLAGTFRVPNPAKICRSTNKGETSPNSWTDVLLRTDFWSCHCLAKGEGVILAGIDDHIFRSIDNGVTWVDRGRPSPGHSIYDLSYFGSNIWLGVTSGGHAIRSTDSGMTWEDLGLIAEVITENLLCMVNLDNVLCYAGSDEGKLYKTESVVVPVPPHSLLCEQKTNPTDVTDPQPEFSAINP